MIAVKATYCVASSAVESINLPPLARALMLQPVAYPGFLVAIDNLVYEIPAAAPILLGNDRRHPVTPPVLDRISRTPPALDRNARTPPALYRNARTPPVLDRNARTPPVLDRNDPTPPVRDTPPIDRSDRTVIVKFVAAHIRDEELMAFFCERLISLSRTFRLNSGFCSNYIYFFFFLVTLIIFTFVRRSLISLLNLFYQSSPTRRFRFIIFPACN